MKSDLIFETVRTGDFTTETCRFGSGKRALLILPGMSMKSVVRNGVAIEAQFSGFRETHTVWVFDRRSGFGEGYSVREMADDTAAVMEKLGIADADVFGASQGGMIGLSLAARYPALVRKLLVACSACRPTPTSKAVMGRWAELADAGDVRALNRDAFEKIYSPEYRARYKTAFEALEKEGTPEEVKRFGILARACLSLDLSNELDRIRCPVFVVGSRQDHALSVEASEEIAERLNCPAYYYEGYSHAAYDEAPDFLSRAAEFFHT